MLPKYFRPRGWLTFYFRFIAYSTFRPANPGFLCSPERMNGTGYPSVKNQILEKH